ncbi:MAG: DUF3500 domain-containing protein [Acidobacteria bacterium]|nr:DUF3500 domain-containing protein [Acidobacteriota bacterium]
MRKNLFRIFLASAAILLLAGAYSRTSSPSTMADAANAFLASLNEEQAGKAKFKLDNEDERHFWHFIPSDNIPKAYGRPRRGAPLMDLTPHQKHLAQALLAAGLSQRGYLKAVTVMSLEDILRQIEKDTVGRRNPEKYFFSVFGEPSATGVWGYRVEGHHLSLHFLVVNGKVAGTPTFYGTNPAEVREGPRKGLRVLGVEEDLGRELVQSLTPEQAKVAIVDPKAPNDILTAANRTAELKDQPPGISAAKLNAKQRGLLNSLLEEYGYNVTDQIAAGRIDQIRKAGTNINFAWAGGTKRGEPHYYRVQGPTFLVEYDNTQNGANHVHSVWRELKGDFGDDLLAAHYKASHGK